MAQLNLVIYFCIIAFISIFLKEDKNIFLLHPSSFGLQFVDVLNRSKMFSSPLKLCHSPSQIFTSSIFFSLLVLKDKDISCASPMLQLQVLVPKVNMGWFRFLVFWLFISMLISGRGRQLSATLSCLWRQLSLSRGPGQCVCAPHSPAFIKNLARELVHAPGEEASVRIKGMDEGAASLEQVPDSSF